MTISEMFMEFLDALKIDNADQISLRYGEITSSLNKKFRESDSKTANSLQVVSHDRWSAIKGI
jgi:transposase